MATWNLTGTRNHLLICNGGSCMREGAEEVTLAIRDEIAVLSADASIHTTRTRCNGRCEDACVVISYPEGTWYKGMTPDAGRALVRERIGIEEKGMQEYITYSYSSEHGFVPADGIRAGRLKPQRTGER